MGRLGAGFTFHSMYMMVVAAEQRSQCCRAGGASACACRFALFTLWAGIGGLGLWALIDPWLCSMRLEELCEQALAVSWFGPVDAWFHFEGCLSFVNGVSS